MQDRYLITCIDKRFIGTQSRQVLVATQTQGSRYALLMGMVQRFGKLDTQLSLLVIGWLVLFYPFVKSKPFEFHSDNNKFVRLEPIANVLQ